MAMRLRTFAAATMKEAMADIRANAGPDAIIVSNARGRGGRGVTVTVAIEPEAAATKPAKETPRRSAIAAEEEDEAFDPGMIAKVLAFHRTPDRLAAKLKGAVQAMDCQSAALALGAAFDTTFGFSPLPDIQARPVMLVGPPGAGKTVTAAKLAVEARLRSTDVRLLTTDAVRTGAIEQLGLLARLLELEVQSAATAGELEALLAQGGGEPGATVTIIDSPGVNPHSEEEISALRRLVGAGDIEPVLVLATGGDALEAAEVAAIYRELGVRRLIFTRIDAAKRFGDILAAAHAGALSFAGISHSPYVADPLQSLNSLLLARLFMNGRDQTEVRATAVKAIK